MKNIRAKILATSLVLAAVSPAAFAADGTITFTGRVSAQTCTISGNGGTSRNFTVTLPPASASTLAADGNFAGRTPFNIRLTNCTPNTGNVAVFFESGPNVDQATGRLRNTATGSGAATNVQVGVLNADLTNIAVGLTFASQRSQRVAITAGAATLQYYAQYVATGGAATAGNVSTSTLYSVVYP